MGIGLVPSRWEAHGPDGKLIGFHEPQQPEGA